MQAEAICAEARRGAAAGYAAAAFVGLLALAALLPPSAIGGVDGVWRFPPDDLSQNLTGHLAFQLGPWGLPLLQAPNLVWPLGASIAMTDSNPLVSLAAKVIASVIGRPVNLFGFFLAACWLLQPVAAVYALRSFGARSLPSCLAAAILAVLFPALLARAEHINLCAHFLILFALGMSVRLMHAAPPATWRLWVAPTGLLAVTVLIHPYLFLFALALFAAPALQRLVMPQRQPVWATAGLGAAMALPVALFVALSGTLGGGEFGFGTFSMNLASPVWPQHSGIFGADLPILDATGGQGEGFNYLGAGILLLLAVGGALVLRPRTISWRFWWPLLAVLAALVAIALSTKVYLGPVQLLAIESTRIDILMGVVRASGRAFWPVGYALLLGAIHVMERRMSRPALAALLALAVGLQVADTAPLRAATRAYWQGVPAPISALRPGDGTLLAAPSLCEPAVAAEIRIAQLRLDAIRAGMNLNEVRLSRGVAGTSCESLSSDLLELALRDGELRAFVGINAIARFRRAALGDGIACRFHTDAAGAEASQSDMILCRRATAPAEAPGPSGSDVPALRGAVNASADLQPLLSSGWREGAQGVFWSNGPRATLLFRVAGLPEGARLRLTLDGVAKRPGGDSRVTLRAGANTWPPDAATPVEARLRDLTPGQVDIPVPAEAIRHGMLRIVFDIPETVDPRTRAGAIPVRWAGIRLHALDLLPAP